MSERYLGAPKQVRKIKTPLYGALGFLVAPDLFIRRMKAERYYGGSL
jgi:hypothetical protein